MGGAESTRVGRSERMPISPPQDIYA